MSNCLRLKKSNCKNCYKCIRHCPVKSIRFSGNQAHIIGNECILCGHCFVVCPQGAKEIVDEREKVKVLLQSGDPVVVSLAPSYIANYEGVGIEAMREALQKLGFYDVEETAIGATMVKREYDKILCEENRDILISSCCHSVNLLIQKHFPKALPYLADVLSPMSAHCKDIKRRIPNAKTVFIGPCVAKKDEAEMSGGLVDACLTYEELTEWLKAEKITLRTEIQEDPQSLARFFPTTGGILKTMEKKATDYQYLAIEGVENCIAALEDILSGKIHKCFIEMSACIGSCVGGPVMEKYHRAPLQDYLSVARYAGREDFPCAQPQSDQMRRSYPPIPQEAFPPMPGEIEAILKEMGKTSKEMELNCGSCGYNTCREKAIAVFQGKAEISMCLPFLMNKAEDMSKALTRNAPDGILMVNAQLEVQQINPAALRILNLRSEAAILGEQVMRILDPKPFISVRASGRGIHDEMTYLSEYDRYVEMSIIPTEQGRMFLCIMRDVTEAEYARRRKEDLSRQTIEVADRVVDKQMRIVQEIASLLGETAAETKIALSKLKESINE